MRPPVTNLTLASLITLASAASCTSNIVLAWPYTPRSNGGGGGSSTCNGDATCEALVAEGQCDFLGLIDDEDSTCVQKLRKLKRVAFLDNSLLCLDQQTGDYYHDDVGDGGNARSGVYTVPDGKVTTITGVSAEATSSSVLATGSTIEMRPSHDGTSSVASSSAATSAASPFTASTGSASASTAVPTAAADRYQVNTLFGTIAAAMLLILTAMV